MNKWNDIFRRVDCSSILSGYHQTNDINKKKQITSESLKLYLLNKLAEMNASKNVSVSRIKDITVEELLDILGEVIPEEAQFDTLRFVTHYLTAVASNLQGWEIVWPVEESLELIESPMVTFNEEGKWDTITTHKLTPYAQVAKFVYQVFNEQLLVKKDIKQLSYKKEQ